MDGEHYRAINLLKQMYQLLQPGLVVGVFRAMDGAKQESAIAWNLPTIPGITPMPPERFLHKVANEMHARAKPLAPEVFD